MGAQVVGPAAGGSHRETAWEGEGHGRILVVDDDPAIRRILTDLLAEEGYAVHAAANGAEALDLAARHPPRVILLDMRMPVLDGWQFAATYRKRPGAHAPIVVITAAHDAEERAAQIDADAWLSKPFDLDAVIALVARLTRRAV